MSSPACADGYDTPAQQREDSTTFMGITVGYGDPARGQVRKLLRRAESGPRARLRLQVLQIRRREKCPTRSTGNIKARMTHAAGSGTKWSIGEKFKFCKNRTKVLHLALPSIYESSPCENNFFLSSPAEPLHICSAVRCAAHRNFFKILCDVRCAQSPLRVPARV